MRLSLTPENRKAIGYVLDAIVICVVTIGGLYVLSHPEKIDAFLNWMIDRPLTPSGGSVVN